MKYFFSIAYSGVNKNGNSTYRITGFEAKTGSCEFTPLGGAFMKNVIGGRYSYNTESIITQKNIYQIIETLNNNFDEKDFAYGVVRG